MARMVQCIKLGREAEGLDFAPYPGELGKRILKTSARRLGQWLAQAPDHADQREPPQARRSTRARKYLAEQMENFSFRRRRDRQRLRATSEIVTAEVWRGGSAATNADLDIRSKTALGATQSLLQSKVDI